MNHAEDDEYEVVIIRYGTRETLRSRVFLNYEVYGESDGPIRMDYYFWVIRNAHRTFVVDTGYSEEGGQHRGRHHLISPATALSLLGVDPDHATVIVTHAHYDHAGNLDLFPHSTVILPATEYEFWTGPYAQRQQYRHAVEDRDIAQLRRAHREGRLRLHAGTSSLAPGIEMIELGGHSPGQCVLTVNTTDGVVLLASDATHFYEQIERDMPFHIVADLTAMYAGFDRMKDLVRDTQVILIPGHDPAVLDRHRPYEGDLAGIAASIGQVAVRT
ncbi:MULTISPECIES: N-acyl homoserine lactonase family protein [unclassified Rhodococcus (in: high G+C Gram-positive bacteria)]|jgi:glyoxylase-like metal-dependent hydrolase (beta-lactamase superfamily II)|uniref:N-acyl homoserine lactonase family protein n=1 Tax=unclassified Rhodococcus (in: high G+C Gram-positive bacteria) TaxID=192944 RepID=UPI0002D80D0B|nr:N-acyl homoserine lactonase family protein [Rhodococcus sp. DK17]